MPQICTDYFGRDNRMPPPDEVGEIRGISFIKIETAHGEKPFSGLKKSGEILGRIRIEWWAMRDSNPRPTACKADALTNCANRPLEDLDSAIESAHVTESDEVKQALSTKFYKKRFENPPLKSFTLALGREGGTEIP